MSRKFACYSKVTVLFFMVSILLSTSRLLAEEDGKAIIDPIMIDSGLISGKKISETGNEVRAYLGIPYAAPPVGELRWKPPQPAIPWTGVRDATQYSIIAPQSATLPFDIPQDEDCLYLNVVTPAKYVNEKLPVMVWLHAGAYIVGSGNNPIFNNYRLPQAGVIVVTVNMRLGVFGLLAHPLLSEESPRGVSGNYMFLDILASLEWVKKNIAAFGGDPDNVTIFGESGGGNKAAALVASPLAKGLFKRAICQSGSPVPGSPLSRLEKAGEAFFSKLGAATLEEARKIPWKDIAKAGTELENDPMKLNMAIDGWFISDNPESIFSAGDQNAVQIMVGLNQGEFAASFIYGYVNMLSGARKKGSKGYAYIFDQVPANWREKGGVALHEMDVPYTFGDYDNSYTIGDDDDTYSDVWWRLYQAEIPYGLGPEDNEPALSEADKKVSEAMMAMWAQFARTGNPSVKGLIMVPAWEPDSDYYLYITDPLQIKTGFSTAAYAQENITDTSKKKPQLSGKEMEKLLGVWQGKPDFPKGMQIMSEIDVLVFRFEMTKKDKFVGFMDIPDVGVSDMPMTNIEMNDGIISFEIGDPGDSAEFNGNLTDKEIIGKLKWFGPSSAYNLILKKGEYKAQVFHLNLPKETMDQLLGKWNGVCGLMGPVVYRFEITEHGDFVGSWHPEQAAGWMQFTDASLSNGKLVLNSMDGEFKGEISGGQLVGEWVEMERSTPLSLTKEEL